MRKLLAMLCTMFICFFGIRTVASAAIEDAKLPENWESMDLEEKIQYVVNMKLEFVLEYYFDIPSTVENIGDIYGKVLGVTAREFLDKYEMVFKKEIVSDSEYLLLDFNEGEYMVLYQKIGSRHYGTFTGDIISDLILSESTDGLYKTHKYKYTAYMTLTHALADGSQTDSGFTQCKIDDALSYLFELH